MTLYLVVVLSIFLCCCGVQGTSNVKQNHRNINLDHEPRFISILPTEDDEFDCVDIYKQPAFDHPLLKNHKIQLNPSLSKELTKSRGEFPNEVDLKNKGCPSGMVPIQKSKAYNPFTQDFPGEHFATLDTNNGATYHGAQATLSLYNPPATGKQYSMSQISVLSGPLYELNSIQAGWALITLGLEQYIGQAHILQHCGQTINRTDYFKILNPTIQVNPTLYGDNSTYMTVRWTTDGFKNTGCYNTLCPGFMQVDPTFRPGQPFINTSIIKGDQYVLDISITQEQSTGDWWLASGNIQVGYWPKELFNHLDSGADVVRYGGITMADGQSPPMGSGEFPSNDYHSVCFMAEVKIVDSDFKLVDIVDGTMSGNTDVPKCYDLHYFGFQGPTLGQTFSFGGPGGECGT